MLAGVAVLAVLGCGDDRPTRVPIAGRVLIDNKPLTFGDVKFVPDGARPSSGKIDKDGHFTLTCYDGEDGAVLGLHRVQVSTNEVVDREKVIWHAPIKYANYRTSEMTYEVKEPTESLTIELNSDGAPAKIYIDDASK
jgi:hypothetical protein